MTGKSTSSGGFLVGSVGNVGKGESRVARARKDAAQNRRKKKQKVSKEDLMKALVV